MKKMLFRDISVCFFWFDIFLLFIHRCKLKQHYRTNKKDSNKTKKGTTDKNLLEIELRTHIQIYQQNRSYIIGKISLIFLLKERKTQLKN